MVAPVVLLLPVHVFAGLHSDCRRVVCPYVWTRVSACVRMPACPLSDKLMSMIDMMVIDEWISMSESR